MRLFLTCIGTLWVTAVIVAYIAFGQVIPVSGQQLWWLLGWVLAGALITTPFIIYARGEDLS